MGHGPVAVVMAMKLWLHHHTRRHIQYGVRSHPSSFYVWAVGLLWIAWLFTPARADCECGYLSTIDGTGDNGGSHALFTDLFETDFTRIEDISKDMDWARQAFNLTEERARGDYGEMFAVENVFGDQHGRRQKQEEKWNGEGSTGLKLVVRSQLVNDMVPVAEIDTQRLDILWGTFRASMKITDIPGTCAAFFWYFNDTQEIDMEFLSKDFNTTNSSYPVSLVLQSRAAAIAGYDAAKTGNFVKAYLPFNPTLDFHEYRIDYLPGRVFFYADGVKLAEMGGDAVPSSPGHLILQHWSNGNKFWSGGPPAEDAALTVRYVKAYFNSSAAQRQRDWEGRCRDGMEGNAICRIPDVTPSNGSAADWFFMDHPDMAKNQTISGKADGAGVERPWWLGTGLVVFMTALALAL